MLNYKTYTAEVITWLSDLDLMLEERDIVDSDIRMEVKKLLTVTKVFQEASPTTNEMDWLEEKIHVLNENIPEMLKQANRVQGSEQPVPIGKHKLPPLPYPYNGLEPVISEEIMRLHHDKHHQAYVDGLNKAELMMQKARQNNEYSLIKHWEREAAFHGSGHYLHTIFWEIMSPDGGGMPKGNLLKQIEHDFGSFGAFKKHFSEAAKAVEGVGWALLVWVPRAKKLEILQSERHMILTQWDTIPLLVLDVWEHAYYLQYRTNKGEYVDNWWRLINWPEIASRYEKARQLTWKSQ